MALLSYLYPAGKSNMYRKTFGAINGILLPKMFWSTVKKNSSIDWEKKLKLKAENFENSWPSA